MIKIRRSSFIFCGFLLAAVAPWLSDCSANDGVDQARELGKYLSQHGYGTVPVDRADDNRQIVEAKIDGTEVSLVLDTGCDKTCLKNSCARHLKLDVHDTNEQNWGVGGAMGGRSGVALVSSFKLDDYEINRTNTIRVLPKSAYTEHSSDGLLGYDYLHLNAVILPVGARFFLFKPGNSPVVAIDHYMDLLGFKPFALRHEKAGLVAEGHINGQPLTAIIDCGAAFTTFDLGYVRKTLGIDVSAMPLYGQGLDGRRLKAYGFTPKVMDLGSMSLPSLKMQACDAPTFRKGGFNVLLGYDFLASHQAIIDLGNETLWLK